MIMRISNQNENLKYGNLQLERNIQYNKTTAEYNLQAIQRELKT